MGIQGLLPLLKPIHKPVSMSEFSGQTVGIDTYCWLHKGAYGCAMEIVEGKKTKVYLNYVLKRIDMLLYHNVKPYLVLDGGNLPSKANKETERRRSRQENKAKGLALLRAGNKSQAHECFQKCVDITPEMALEVVKACRERNISYIVAPYEADAQLAYLMKTGITQATISEDSDLLVYGCNRVIFKMDECGMGTLVDLADLPKLTDLRMHEFTMEKFKYMCILSGCDYLPSIKGVGLKTANKLLRKHSTIEKLVRSIRLENKLKVPVDYEKSFQQAYETFLYQLVFDPSTSSLVPLTPLPDGVLPGDLAFAGPMLSPDKALGIALGNLNPITNKMMDDYDPDNREMEQPLPTLPSDTPSICAFSFASKKDRQSLTPSSLESLHVADNNKTLVKGPSLGHCRRFLLPPLKKTSKEKEELPDNKDLMNMYTFVKRKDTSSLLKRSRTVPNGSGISRKPRHDNPFKTATSDEPVVPSMFVPKKSRLKNPFRTRNEESSDNESSATGSTSCYFKTEDVDNLTEQEDMDIDEHSPLLLVREEKTSDDLVNQASAKKLDDTPCLPRWKPEESDTNGSSEDDKENSPTPENVSAPTLFRDTSSYKSTSLEREEGTDTMEDSSQPIADSQRSSKSDSSVDTVVTSKMKRVLNLNSSENNPKLPSTCQNSTPISGLHKFTYQPKKKSSKETISRMSDVSTSGGSESVESLPLTQDVVDSGYLSDEEESTDADTPSESSQDVVNRLSVKTDSSTPLRSCSSDMTSKKSIQLKNTTIAVRRTTGLGRCKSLGISKRKSSTKPGNATSTLFHYFEFNKNKRARLEPSRDES